MSKCAISFADQNHYKSQSRVRLPDFCFFCTVGTSGLSFANGAIWLSALKSLCESLRNNSARTRKEKGLQYFFTDAVKKIWCSQEIIRLKKKIKSLSLKKQKHCAESSHNLAQPPTLTHVTHQCRTNFERLSPMWLTHSFLTAKQLFPGFFPFFYAIFKYLRPEHDCYAKFTSCST